MKHLRISSKSIIIIILLITHNSFAGEERNLLSGNEEITLLKKNLILNDQWFPFPNYNDRDAWKKLPGNIRTQYINDGERYLNYSWPAIPASTYLDYIRTGSREIMQAPYRDRIKAFRSLVMAELMEGEGRFIDQIINGIWVYCEQTYWGLSAHLTLQKMGTGLPDSNDPTIDLGVGQIACDLAYTWKLLHAELDRIHPEISRRLKREIQTKVLQPYYQRDDFWWMGFNSGHVNNWNPWCNYNVLNCIMLIETDPAKKMKGVSKVLKSIDKFINYYPEDGGCEEGPSYWSHAGAKLFDCLELISRITNDEINIYSQEVIKNMGRYIYRAYISNPYFVNFADASAKITSRPGVIYRFGKRIEDPLLSDFGAYLANTDHWGEDAFSGKIELALENLFNLDEIVNTRGKEPLIGSFYLPETQLMAAREQEGSTNGFYFAAKGGYNQESHNHNDVGNFILYYDGKPCLIDVGVGTYTSKTFSKHRYELWNMQSQYHNLPRINGIDQHDGTLFKAQNCEYSTNKSSVTFSLEIQAAYPKEAGVKRWTRSYSLKGNNNFVIRDQYNLDNICGENTLFFMTCCNIEKVKEGRLLLKGKNYVLAMEYDPELLEAKVKTVEIKDQRISRAWPQGLFRIELDFLDMSKKGENSLVIKALKQ